MIVFLLLGLGVAVAACGADTPSLDTADGTDTTGAQDTVTTSTVTSTTVTSTTVTSKTEPTGSDSELTVERGNPLGQNQGGLSPGEVKLWVSNQSFEDDPVEIVISVDGVEIIAEAFEVKGQHNWIPFDLKGLDPGPHTLTVTSSTGVEQTETFTAVAEEPRWLVLDYWYYLDDAKGRYFSFAEFDHPVAFA